jgi:hypothetical protein
MLMRRDTLLLWEPSGFLSPGYKAAIDWLNAHPGAQS